MGVLRIPCGTSAMSESHKENKNERIERTFPSRSLRPSATTTATNIYL